MQYGTVNGCKISRLGLGTKRFPTEDSSRVVHLDVKTASAIFQAAIDGGVDFFDTSYSNHKGEAESFLGDECAKVAKPLHVCTSFFEMVDPRYEYVFQKQLKKLGKECIDFYAIEGVTDINKEVNVESGAIDYFFERKEAGQIAQIGFNSELSPDELAKFLKRYPWDFVRMRINFFDWFEGRTREAYEIATEAGVPILAHGALRVGPASLLKEDALAVLRQGGAHRSSVEWGLMFVKSLENVRSVSCNVHSVEQIESDIAVFADDAVLSDSEMEMLKEAARAQRGACGRRS